MGDLMNKVIDYFANRYSNNTNVISLAIIEGPNEASPVIDGFDFLILVISDEGVRNQPSLSHYIKENWHIQERWIKTSELEHWILEGQNRNIIQWLLECTILTDRDQFLEKVKKKLIKFPSEMRERKLLIEFSLFLRCYLQSKEYLQNN